VPAAIVVLLVAIPLGMAFDLLHAHSYTLQNHEYQLGDQYLVAMPDRMFGMFDEMTLPNFSALVEPKAWKLHVFELPNVRVEVICTKELCERLVEYLRREILTGHYVTVSVEHVDVLRRSHFEPLEDSYASDRNGQLTAETAQLG